MAVRGVTQRTEPLPYYKWFWRDYRANRKVQRLSYVERGFYRELLDEQWDVGWIPNDVDKLAEVCSCPVDVMREAWPNIKHCFEPMTGDSGKFINPRMERERTESDKKRTNLASAGRLGAIAKQMAGNADKSHIARARAEQQQVASDCFDGHEWCLRTCKAYPTWGNPDALDVPPSISAIYHETVEREAVNHGDKLGAAKWLLAITEQYAHQHADGSFVMGLDRFFEKGYTQVRHESAGPVAKRKSTPLSQRVPESEAVNVH